MANDEVAILGGGLVFAGALIKSGNPWCIGAGIILGGIIVRKRNIDSLNSNMFILDLLQNY